MEKNLYDKVHERVVDITNKTKERVRHEFKNTNPYGKRKLTDDEKINYYDAVLKDKEAIPYMFQNYNPEDVAEVLNELRDLSERRRGYA